jgi:hypothetical protein
MVDRPYQEINMHTTQLKNNDEKWVAIHDGHPDIVCFRQITEEGETGYECEIPYAIIHSFIASQARSNRISRLEDASDAEILDGY